MPRRFNLACHVEGTTVTVAVTGELDLVTVPRLEAQLDDLPEGASELVVDLTNCDFFDSAAVKLLVASERRARVEGWGFAVHAGPELLASLEMFGVAGHITLGEGEAVTG